MSFRIVKYTENTNVVAFHLYVVNRHSSTFVWKATTRCMNDVWNGLFWTMNGDVLNLRGYRLPQNAQIFWISTPEYFVCVWAVVEWEMIKVNMCSSGETVNMRVKKRKLVNHIGRQCVWVCMKWIRMSQKSLVCLFEFGNQSQQFSHSLCFSRDWKDVILLGSSLFLGWFSLLVCHAASTSHLVDLVDVLLD